MSLQRLFGAVFIVFLAGWAGYFFSTSFLSSKQSEWPVLGQVGDFTLVDQDGEPFQSASLKGHTSVINFIFTSCRGSCPVLTRQMDQIQTQAKRLDPKTRYYSISVDPEYDTPERLKAFADKFQVDYQFWKFLTGDLKEIRHAVVESFMTALGEKQVTANEGKDLVEITHGEKFVLVDAKAQIRAFMSAKSEKEIEEILKVIKALSNLEVPTPNSQT